jgi:RNA polymerase sigma-70 factor (ECF subfamily)
MRQSAPSDQQRFDALYQRTHRDLLRYLLRRSRSAEDAAEALSETYLIAWAKLEKIPHGDRGRLWLFGVARNLILKDAARRNTRDALIERLATELRATDPQSAHDDDVRRVLGRALSALSDRDREILTLTAWDGLKPREIAAITGTSANTVRIRLHRARAQLRQELTHEHQFALQRTQ